MNKKINIAIDGHSSCGKSTLAKDLARSLAYVYIDSGAMYRCVALYCIENNIDPKDKPSVIKDLDKIHIEIKYNEQNQFEIYLNEKAVTQRIISIDVSSIVSEISTISEVRKKLVNIQRTLGKNKGVVMDGRDIGTVVFPDAELKLFVTANLNIRTQRRYLELQQKGMATEFDDVMKNLIHRDSVDSSRKESPLLKAEDAVLIDNSYMTIEEQLFLVKKLVEERVRIKNN